MKATVNRYCRGSYTATFPVSTGRGAVLFRIEGADQNWQIYNQFDVEINQWTSKRSMVEYLEDCTEAQIIELSNKQ